MSQLDLALRAGTTQRHVSFVEQGRSQPGRSMVLRLAESMELTLRERNELLLAADFAPVYPESPFDDEALDPVRHALDTILDGHLPYPAIVVRLTLAELQLEAFLPADEHTADVLRRRWG
jgi:transcriptional regulator with XRE-family HTH domain